MANTTPKPADPKPADTKALPAGDPDAPVDAELVDEPKPLGDQSAADFLRGSGPAPAETNTDKRRRLAEELRQAEIEAGVGQEVPHDKILILAGGALVETSGAVPTHHAETPGGFALPVVDVLPHPNNFK